MFLSLSSWIYETLSERQMLQQARQCGYECVEVSAGAWQDRWSWEELRAISAEKGIRIVSAHCCHHEIPADQLDDDAYRKYHETFYANLTNAEGLIVVEHESEPFDDARDVSRAEMLRELAKPYGLMVTFENMYAPPEKLEKLVRLDDVFFTYDPMHAVELAQVAPLSYRGLFDRLADVHAMDSIKDAALGHGIPCGLGEMDWPGIIDALADAGYKGPITVEMQMRRLRRVIEMCKSVYELAYGGDSAARFDLQIEDAFAVYARKYVEGEIRRAQGPLRAPDAQAT